MVWIFALGIIGFCIVSAGFRKLVFSLLALVACISIGLFGYYWYQDYAAKEREAQAKTDAAKYPLCTALDNDEKKAWFNSGGNCRILNGMDPDIEEAFVEDSIAKLKADKIKYAACDIKPFDALQYSACVIRVDGGPQFKTDSPSTGLTKQADVAQKPARRTARPAASSVDDDIPPSALISPSANPR